jgi:TonB family protein
MVFIDESGAVVSVTLRKSMHPIYDTHVLSAARSWKYRPAMKEGLPVPFVKRIELVIP